MPVTTLSANIHPYFPILLYIMIGAAFGVFTLLFGALIRPSRPTPDKLSPYECGNPPFMDARQRVFVRYYLIAVLFVLFDLEVVFLYPWAIVYKKLGLFALIEMILFILILLFGYFYAWRKGALEWD